MATMKRFILHLVLALSTFLVGISADLTINSAYYNYKYPAARYAIPLTFDLVLINAPWPGVEAIENCKCAVKIRRSRRK
jgi:hypothetical protein